MKFYTQTHQHYCGIDLHARSPSYDLSSITLSHSITVCTSFKTIFKKHSFASHCRIDSDVLSVNVTY